MTLNSDIKGPRPSMTEAIKAKCFDCTAQFHDGRRDCYIQKCPLHSRMPYRLIPSNFDWLWGQWSSKHRKQLKKLGLTADEYIKNIITQGRKYKISMSDMIRAKCFRCCGDYSQETVTLRQVRNIKSMENGKVVVRPELIRGDVAIIKGITYKIIVNNNEAGRIECGIRDCPLYWWTPYRTQLPDYSWLFDSEYTKRHRLAISALGISEEEYVQRLLVEKSL